MKTLPIVWQRLVTREGRTCPRCQGTHEEVLRAMARLRALSPLLEPLGATSIARGGGGADIGPLKEGGVPLLGCASDARRYFDVHHTHADTLDKVDPEELAQHVAAIAVLAWALAECEAPLEDLRR